MKSTKLSQRDAEGKEDAKTAVLGPEKSNLAVSIRPAKEVGKRSSDCIAVVKFKVEMNSSFLAASPGKMRQEQQTLGIEEQQNQRCQLWELCWAVRGRTRPAQTNRSSPAPLLVPVPECRNGNRMRNKKKAPDEKREMIETGLNWI
ncbi:Nuclear Receptor Coactivator 7 [Manis pentadactyla]|nr:Nuclear Receptor Coactivator 7 [Manis pentadactyla]